MCRISEKSLTLWRIHLYMAAVVCAFILSFLFSPFSFEWYIGTAVWVAAFLFMYFVYYPVKYNRIRYCVKDGALCLFGGVIYRYEKQMDIGNIQYVHFSAGPLQRLMRLRSAIVVVAGGRLYIPCLDQQRSQELLRLIEG